MKLIERRPRACITKGAHTCSSYTWTKGHLKTTGLQLDFLFSSILLWSSSVSHCVVHHSMSFEDESGGETLSPSKEDPPGSSKESLATPGSGHNLPLSALEAIAKMVVKKIGESPL